MYYNFHYTYLSTIKLATMIMRTSFFHLILSVIVVISISLPVYSQQLSINFFDGTWEEALQAAETQGKFVFVDAYGSFCPPCKMMEEEVFTYKEVAIFYNTNFVSYKVDMEDEENLFFTTLYGVQWLPTLLFFNGDGELLRKEEGGKSTSDFLAMGEQVINMYAAENNLQVLEQVKEDKNLTTNENLSVYTMPNMATFETTASEAKASATPTTTPNLFTPPATINEDLNQYDNLAEYNAHSDNVYAKIVNEKPDMVIPPNQDPSFVKMLQLQELYEVRGNSNPVLLQDYARLLKRYHQPCNSVVNAYLNTQTERLDLTDNRQFIFDFAINAENNAIDYFMQDISYYKKTFGSRTVNKKVYDAVYNSVLMAINDRDYGLFNKAEAILQAANLPDMETKLFTIRAIFYQGIEDWDNYVAVTSAYINQQRLSDPQLLTDVASVYQMYVRNKKALKQALKWTQKAIDIESGYGNNYLLSALHYQMANYTDALDCIDKAIDIADYQDIVYTEGLRLRDKILVQLDK